MSVLYFDCFSGVSGDMMLGALIDAGVPFDGIRDALGGLAIDADTIWTEKVRRAGIMATRFRVRGEDAGDDAGRANGDDAAHAHAAGHGHWHPHVPDHSSAPHRSLAEIAYLIDGSGLSPAARERAKELFQRLGEAEAAIHGISVGEVHLHEVGALDSIIDIVGAVYALEQLGAEQILSSPLNVGSGVIRSSHGHYPVPAPATLRLLEGVPMYAGPQPHELVTPTGALLVTSYAGSYGPMPPMRPRVVGYGAGARDVPDRPNVLRVVLGDVDKTVTTEVVVIEAEIDDMNPQLFGVTMDALLADGALDVFYTPIQMKKNRPGTLLTVLTSPADRERLTTRIFQETTTIGVRYAEMRRECLDRDTIQVTTPYGPVTVKVARRDGRVLNAAPEFEDCLRASRQSGAPVKDVQAAAVKAFLDRRP